MPQLLAKICYLHPHPSPNLHSLLPPTELPPLTINSFVVTEVTRHEWQHDKSMTPGVPFSEPVSPPPPHEPPNNSHLLWGTFMLPSDELEKNFISPATILHLLTTDDTSRFIVHFNKRTLSTQTFRLQAGGGTNC